MHTYITIYLLFLLHSVNCHITKATLASALVAIGGIQSQWWSWTCRQS